MEPGAACRANDRVLRHRSRGAAFRVVLVRSYAAVRPRGPAADGLIIIVRLHAWTNAQTGWPLPTEAMMRRGTSVHSNKGALSNASVC